MFTLDFLNQVANGLEKDSMLVSSHFVVFTLQFRFHILSYLVPFSNCRPACCFHYAARSVQIGVIDMFGHYILILSLSIRHSMTDTT